MNISVNLKADFILCFQNFGWLELMPYILLPWISGQMKAACDYNYNILCDAFFFFLRCKDKLESYDKC